MSAKKSVTMGATESATKTPRSNPSCRSARHLLETQLKVANHELRTLFAMVNRIGCLKKVGSEWVRDLVVSDYTEVKSAVESAGFVHGHKHPHEFTLALDGKLAETFEYEVKTGMVVKFGAVAVEPFVGVGVVVWAKEHYDGQVIHTNLPEQVGMRATIMKRKEEWLAGQQHQQQLPTPLGHDDMKGNGSSSLETPVKQQAVLRGVASDRKSFYESEDDEFLDAFVEQAEAVADSQTDSDVDVSEIVTHVRPERSVWDQFNYAFGQQPGSVPVHTPPPKQSQQASEAPEESQQERSQRVKRELEEIDWSDDESIEVRPLKLHKSVTGETDGEGLNNDNAPMIGSSSSNGGDKSGASEGQRRALLPSLMRRSPGDKYRGGIFGK